MQIDNNILTIVLAVTTVALTVLYFRSYLNNKFAETHRSVTDQTTDLYREMDILTRRLHTLERSCEKSSCKTERNHYNTTA